MDSSRRGGTLEKGQFRSYQDRSSSISDRGGLANSRASVSSTVLADQFSRLGINNRNPSSTEAPFIPMQGEAPSTEVLTKEITDLIQKAQAGPLSEGEAEEEDAEEREKAWEQVQFQALRNPNPSEADKTLSIRALTYFIEDSSLRFEFYTKVFILEPGFRKFLAANPAILLQLVNVENTNQNFAKVIGFFMGLRYTFDLPMSPSEVLVYNTQLALIEVLTQDLYFEQEALPPLPSPFNSFPRPRPDLINFFKNQKILELQQHIEFLDSEIERLSRENIAKEDEKMILAERLREAEVTNQDVRKAIVQKFDEVEIQQGISFTIEFSDQPNGKAGAKIFEIIFDAPDKFGTPTITFLPHHPRFGGYKVDISPLQLGQYSVKAIKMDGQLLQNSTFSFKVVRDYSTIKEETTLPFREFEKPWGLAINQGRLFVTDIVKQKAYYFNSKLEFQQQMETPPVDGKKAYPRGIAVTSDNKFVVVCAEIGKIQTFSLADNGKLLLQFGSGIGDKAGQFKLPRGACIGHNDEIVIVDTDGQRIQVFSKDGEYLRCFGRYGLKELGHFQYPASVAYVPSKAKGEKGRLIVTDCDNSRIQFLEYDGTPIKAFGSLGDEPGKFKRPSGVAVDPHGNIIISDFVANNIQVFDAEGNFKTRFGVGRLSGPRGVAIDAKGKIYVADMENKRIAIF